MHKQNKKLHWIRAFSVLLVFLTILLACSTEKNTFINRTYHSLTAKYNGYFNARELIREGLENYRENAKEDYLNILPIELMPGEEDAVKLYPAVDTAIAKCTKVISKHSMPTASKPSKKKTEHAKWIDQNWLLIGKAEYIRRDYQKALKNFTYIRKFYIDRPSTYQGQLWMVKTYLKMNDITNATRTLQKLNDRILRLQNQSTNKSKSKKSKYSHSSDNKPAPPLPKHFKYHLARVKAMYEIKTKDYKHAIDDLKTALSLAKKKKDKARISFIIGQLLQQQSKPNARKYYSLSIKKDAPFAMAFHAKINRSMVGGGSIDQMVDELNDLAKEDMYFEFRDQIYYAMANLELKRPDRNTAKADLSKSVFFSLNNNLQKGISYEKLGDLSLDEKNYVDAQKYYDSSSQVIPKSYKDAVIIKNKADKLQELVNNINIIEYQDSVQRIALMDEDQRKKFIKDVIKQLKKQEQERKEQEAMKAERLRKLQQTYAMQNQGTGKKFYFSNVKAMQQGLQDFKKVWGQRENEDFWRLSTKPMRIVNAAVGTDTSSTSDSLITEKLNSDKTTDFSVDEMMKNIPLNDSALVESNKKLLAALFNSGMIYKQQLNEDQLAATQFKRVLDKNIKDEHNLPSAFQLYKIYEKSGGSQAYKDYILKNYPNSDYANYLKDPEYFIKKRKRDELALQNYMRSVEHFEHGLYYPVVLKADQVINNEPKNKYRKEYMLLKALAMGRLNNDKTTLLPVLQQAVQEYPNTDVASRAKELIGLIKNGVPPFKLPTKEKSSIFSIDSKKYFVIITVKKNQKANYVAQRISDFDKTYFSRLDLKASDQIYNSEISFVLVNAFNSSSGAQDYIKDYKDAKNYLRELASNDIIYISQENLKIVLQEQKLTEYLQFYNTKLNN